MLIIGSTPGRLYEPPENTKLGAPDEFSEGILEQLEAKGVDVEKLRAQMPA